MATFATSYELTPWAASLDKNQQTIYVPELLQRYVEQSLFYRMVNYQIDLGAMRTGQVVFTQRLVAPPNIAPLDNRALWLPQLYTDSRQIVITCLRFGKHLIAELQRNLKCIKFSLINGENPVVGHPQQAAV